MEPAYSLVKRHPTSLKLRRIVLRSLGEGKHPTSLKLRRIVLRSLGEGEHKLFVRTYP